MDDVFFTTHGDYYVRLPDDDLDWNAAEVGTSEDYWEPWTGSAEEIEKMAQARISRGELPENLQE